MDQPTIVWTTEVGMSPREYHFFLFSDPLDEFIWGEQGMNIGGFEPVLEAQSCDPLQPSTRIVKLSPNLGMFGAIVNVLRLAISIPESIHYFSKQTKYPVWEEAKPETHSIGYENTFPMLPSVRLCGQVVVTPHKDSEKCFHSMSCTFEAKDIYMPSVARWSVEKVIGSEIERYVKELPAVIERFKEKNGRKSGHGS